MENNYSVYKHVNRCNGKVYIGLTGSDPVKRWNGGRGYKSNKHFTSAIQKYGWDSFDHVVIRTGLTKEEACLVERKLIKRYNSKDPEYGYNSSSGGEFGGAGVRQTEESNRRRSATVLKTWSNPELRRKQSERLKGIFRSEETRRKMSEAAKKRGGISEKQKADISRTLRDYYSDPKNRQRLSDSVSKNPVVCVETGVIYKSSHDAYRATGIQQGNIYAVCLGKRNKAGGYHWSFVNGQHANTEVNTALKKAVSL